MVRDRREQMRCPFRKACSVAGLCLSSLAALCWPLAARPKLDVLYFKNGDRWTCEIKELSQSYLSVKLDYVDGTVSVDWSMIDRVESPQEFLVIDLQGNPFVGTLRTSAAGEGEPVLTIGQSRKIRKSDVATMERTDENFWKGLHGSLDGGTTFAKSNSQVQFNFNASVNYIKKTWAAESQFQSTFNSAHATVTNLRNDSTSYALRKLSKNYFVIGVAGFLKSEEQQLDLRSTVGGGLGRTLRSTEDSQLYAFAGAGWTRESYSVVPIGRSTFNSADGMFGATYRYFHFKSFQYTLTGFVNPSMSDPGRVRYSANTALKYEIIKNLYLNVNAYASYDSQPPRNTVKSDYGASTTLGWTF
jgi:hypothetical protein